MWDCRRGASQGILVEERRGREEINARSGGDGMSVECTISQAEDAGLTSVRLRGLVVVGRRGSGGGQEAEGGEWEVDAVSVGAQGMAFGESEVK